MNVIGCEINWQWKKFVNKKYFFYKIIVVLVTGSKNIIIM